MSYAAPPENANRRTRPVIIIDLRCMQDHRYRGRGISGHGGNAVLRARNVSALAQNAWIIGIIDPALDSLPENIIAAVDEIRINAAIPDLPERIIFLQLSPMSDTPHFFGRLLLNPAVCKAVLVYDFIPHDAPKMYLGSPSERFDYMNQMIWLRRYDLFLPLSEGTSKRLSELIHLQGRPSVVTGAAINPALLESRQPGTPRHILLVGGDDARKNAVCAIRAHASAKALQTAGIKLIITGHYDTPRPTEFSDLAVWHGGDRRLLSLPGKVSQSRLVELYRNAYCVIVASKAEGFSLPVVEAMAAGVPVTVSEIPEHAELVSDRSLRFAADDDTALAQILQRLVADPDERARIVASNESIWPRYTGTAVARAIWDAIATTQISRPAIVTGAKPRFAFITPLPPTESGIADFSSTCLQALAPYAEVTAIPHDAVSPLPYISNQFDRVISVMGNGHHHGRIFDLLRRYGGACICHDARLMHFCAAKFGIEKTAAIATQELQRPVHPREIELWLHDEMARQTSCLGILTDVASPLIFHAQHTAAQVTERFGVPAAYIPFGIYRPWDTAALTRLARAAARQRLNFADNSIHIVSFGFIASVKGLEAGIKSIAALKALGVIAHLHWLGFSAEDLTKWRQMAARLGIGKQISFYDRYVTETEYRDHLAAADFGLQLRLAGRGNISGALQDCITAGLPTVAEADLAASIDAPDYVQRVDSAGDPKLIAEAFLSLHDAGLHINRNFAARAEYCDIHSMDKYAQRLCEVLGF